MTDAADEPKNPFRGLTPFQEGDQLFGRDRDQVVFEDRLYSARTTLLFAASGVGKSSFLNAKVAPALKHDHFVVRHARWGVRAPLDGLRDSWIAALVEHLWERPELRRAVELGDAQTSDALKAALEQLWAASKSPLEFARRFTALDTVLLLDQFEEPLNSLVHDPNVDALVEALSALINDTKLPLRVVFSMRQEFLAELSLFENRVPDLFANYYNLRHPTPEQAEVIISSTVAAAEGSYDENGVSALVRDLLLVGGLQRTAGESGETRPMRFVVPPVLQIVCSRMWNANAAAFSRRELAFAAGYVSGQAREVVQAFVEELIDELDDAQKALLAKALEFLVSRQGGKIAYEVGALAQHLECGREELDAALTLLATEPDRVFRRIDRPDGTTWYELYHDVYATALTAWKASYEADRERRAKAEAAELEQQATARLAVEKKRSKWNGVLGTAVAVLFVSFIGTCSTAWDARTHRRALVEAGEDYAKARAAYDEIHGNFLKTLLGSFDADEELAKFWDRRADKAALLESRDRALVYALEALAMKDTPERRRSAAQIVGDDLSEIVETYHTSDPIVALSRDGERYATLGRGGVVVRSIEKPGGAVLSVPRVEFTDVLLSDDGNVVWALGRRTPESKGNAYEQKAPAKGDGELGLWMRRVDRPTDAPTAWIGADQLGTLRIGAWSISGDGSTAVTAFHDAMENRTFVASRAFAFGDFGRIALGTLPLVDASNESTKTWPWEVALRRDGSAVAFQRTSGEIVERALGADGEARVLAADFAEVSALCYSPAGDLLAMTESDSESLHLLDVSVDPPRPRSPGMNAVGFDAFDARGQRVYCRNRGWLEAWDVDTGKLAGRIPNGPLAPPIPLVAGGAASVFAWVTGPTKWFARFAADLSQMEWSRNDVVDSPANLFAPRAGGAECAATFGLRTLRRFASKSSAAVNEATVWNGWTSAVLASDGKRVLVHDQRRYALLDAATGKSLREVVDLGDEGTQLSLDFDANGRRAFALVGETIRELESGAEIATGRLSALARIFAVGSGDDLLVEADDTLWLLSTTNGHEPRSIAGASGDDALYEVTVDASRSHAAIVTSSASGQSFVDVCELATGDTRRAFEDLATIRHAALSAGATRIAVVGSDGDSEDSALVVIDVATGTLVTPVSIVIGRAIDSLAFSPDGKAVIARTPNALVRVAFMDTQPTPQVRFLRRASVVNETLPNWFDADDPKGERPRVLVLDVNGHVALERVRFDDADVEPIAGEPQALRTEWQRRLDLQVDGNGRVAPPSGTTGGGF